MGNKKILILTGGPLNKLDSFIEPTRTLRLNVQLASFYDLEYFSEANSGDITLKNVSLSDFKLIYFRVVGRRVEEASLVANYAKAQNIRLVDKVYESDLTFPSTISKALEMRKLINSGLPMPATYVGRLTSIESKCPNILGYPFVIKSTTGKKARDVWKVDDDIQLSELVKTLVDREKNGEHFFAQKLTKASQRYRLLVIGDKVVGAITRPTKWRKSWTEKVNGEYPEGKKEALKGVPTELSELALKAAEAAGLDIAGVDILEEDETHKLFVIEANAAPSWKLIAKDTGVNVEAEILKYLTSL